MAASVSQPTGSHCTPTTTRFPSLRAGWKWCVSSIWVGFRHSRAGGNPEIPADQCAHAIPACAGMTKTHQYRPAECPTFDTPAGEVCDVAKRTGFRDVKQALLGSLESRRETLEFRDAVLPVEGYRGSAFFALRSDVNFKLPKIDRPHAARASGRELFAAGEGKSRVGGFAHADDGEERRERKRSPVKCSCFLSEGELCACIEN